MVLTYNKCKITIEDNFINCVYAGPYDRKSWQITLTDMHICYKEESEEEVTFTVENIKELQFEMVNGGVRYQDIPACIAYAILKADTNPQKLFYFSIHEDYVLLNQTKAYDFCNQILKHMGERYSIPIIYKLSVDTKEKQNISAFIAVYPFILFAIIALLYFLTHQQ